MASIFALWGRILRARPDVYLQLLLTIVAAALVVGVIALGAALQGGRGAGALAVLAIALVIAIVAFGYGAALGALGEAARGAPPSRFWQRGYRLWGRTLGLFVVDFLIAMVLGIVVLAFLGGVGALAGLSQLATGSLQAPEVVRLLGFLLSAVVVLVLVVGPYMQAGQAITYIDELPVLVAFSRAFGEAYGHGRIWHWLLVLAITIVLDLASNLISGALGTLGQVLTLLLSPAVLWLSTALAFAACRVHEIPAQPEPAL